MSHIANVARKFRRALRNDTGVHFSLEELRALAELGALDLVTSAENRELCPPKAEASESGPLEEPIAPSRPTASDPHRTPKHLGMAFVDALKLGC